MKLRVKPEDFFVEELPSLEFKDSGKFAIFKVSKTNLTSFAAEKSLATRCNVSFKQIGFAGLKDSRARTIQYYSVATDKPDCGVFEERQVKSELVGFLDEPLRTGDLKGNKFIIIVRDLSDEDVETAKRNLDFVKRGVPNYFDSQRFGSLKGVDGFIGKDVLNGDFESAVKKVIGGYTKSRLVYTLKTFVLAHWGDWKACADEVRRLRLEKSAIGNIIFELEQSGDFAKAFGRLFAGVRQLFFSAYQSFIWNECVKKLVGDGFKIPYRAGELVFNPDWHDDGVFLTVAPDMPENEIVSEVLASEGLSLDSFKTDQHIFIARERPLTFKPEDFLFLPSDDELHEGRKKAVVSFVLPKGSYATIILKALFQQ